MSEAQIAEIELDIETAKEHIDLHAALQRLENNRDFQKIFLEKYLKDEAVRLVHLKGSPQTQDETSQKNIMREMDAVGCVTAFLRTIHAMGLQAESALETYQESLDELRAEDAAHG